MIESTGNTPEIDYREVAHQLQRENERLRIKIISMREDAAIHLPKWENITGFLEENPLLVIVSTYILLSILQFFLSLRRDFK